MAKIRVDIDYPVYSGASVTFNAPCDCTAADGLIVYHPEGNQTFVFCDAHGEDLSGIGDVFAEGASVKVILDVANSKAFVQNGDNNTHLANILAGLRTDLDHLISPVESGSYVGTGTYGPNNKTVLTFGFAPKIVFISSSNRLRGCGEITLYRGNSVAHFLMATTNDGTTDEPVWRSANVSWDGNTVSLYYNDQYFGTEVQQNRVDVVYYYVAIG